MNSRFARLLSVTAFVTLAGLPLAARQAQAPASSSEPVNLQQALPFDAAVKVGTLPNGLKYYVRQNSRPANRVVAAAGREDRIARRSGRSAGARAHARAHGVQRQRRTSSPASSSRTSNRSARGSGRTSTRHTGFEETIYMLDLPSDKPEVVAEGADGVRRLRRRPDARSGGDRQGARRRDRRVARRPRRGLAHPRQADPGPLLSLALRGAPADRQARHRCGRFPPARLRAFYDTCYRPDRHGGRRGRRHRRSRSWRRWSRRRSAGCKRAAAAPPERNGRGAAARGNARQRRDRPRDHAVVGLAHPTSGRATPDDRSPTTAASWWSGSSSRC